MRCVRWVMGMLGCLALATIAACGGEASSARPKDDGRPRIVATTTMIADMARQIGGDDIVVISIMKEGEDPHVYQVRPRDAQTIRDADLVLMNGLHLEATLDRVVTNNVSPDRVVRLAESPRITPLRGAGDSVDPHCWFNVEYFMIYAETARDALIAIDPDKASAYEARTAAYLQQLRELHEWVLAEIATVPAEQRVMVTSHDAFAYYGNRYGIEVHGVIGISTEEQPRPQEIEKLEELVRQRNVKALFIETSVNPTLNEIVRKIAQRSGATVGGTLFSDSLGLPDGPAGTYIDMMRHNTRTIVEALR